MELPPINGANKKPDIISPGMVRDLSLGRVTEDFGTAGLYVRLQDSLERAGFGDDDLVQLCLQLGLALHANDLRTNGHYTDHLMRVTLHLLDTLEVRDRNIIAAAPLHDSREDHPRDLVFALTGERIDDRAEALRFGREVLARITNDEVVDIIDAVTNPEVLPGQNKLEVYAAHTHDLVSNSPKGRVLKIADFVDNAGGNHATFGPKQRKLDEKYIQLFRIHRMGLFLPDSLVTGEPRRRALDILTRGHIRALGRMAALDILEPDGQSPSRESSLATMTA